MRTFTIAIAALLAGCVTDAPIRTADGRLGHAILCPGALDWAHCLKRAGDLCGAQGYDTVSKNDETGFAASYTTPMAVTPMVAPLADFT